MFSFFYNSALLLFLIATAPKWLWQWVCLKKYRQSLKQRITGQLPPLSKSLKSPVIWIHAVSVGETRASIPLYQKIKQELPHASIIISSTTETGHETAKTSLPDAAAHFFLPLDFSWNIKKVLKTYQPNLLVLMEGEYWYHLLLETKKSGAKIVLANGTLSKRSFQRFMKLSFFAQRLFPLINHFCVQSNLIKERFLGLQVAPEKISITGNIKLDHSPTLLNSSEKKHLKAKLGITSQDKVVVIGSTHEGEEAALLESLKEAWKTEPHLKVILVPRHPERFKTVSKELDSLNIAHFNYSQHTAKTGQEKVVLVDAMGILNSCYQLAEIAIVAGSFTNKVGGHNIFEPIDYKIPVLFGPHMFSQPELRTLALEAHAAIEVTLQTLAPTLLSLLQDKHLANTLKHNAEKLSLQVHGSTKKTWKALFPFLLNQQ